MVHTFYEASMLLDAPPDAFPVRSIAGSAPIVKEADFASFYAGAGRASAGSAHACRAGRPAYLASDGAG